MHEKGKGPENDRTAARWPLSSILSDDGGKPGTAVGDKIVTFAFFKLNGLESFRLPLSIPSYKIM